VQEKVLYIFAQVNNRVTPQKVPVFTLPLQYKPGTLAKAARALFAPFYKKYHKKYDENIEVKFDKVEVTLSSTSFQAA
jgi:hypothetical protein